MLQKTTPDNVKEHIKGESWFRYKLRNIKIKIKLKYIQYYII